MLSVAGMILMLAVSGCGTPTPAATPVPSPTTAPTATATPAAPTPTPTVAAPAVLTLDLLKNAEYNSDFTASKKAKLVDGKYEEAAAPGSASKVTVQLLAQPVAFADLNGDGLDDALVIIVSSGGGSGSFYTLNVVLNDKGTPRHAASLPLGDRVQVKTLAVKGVDISVNMVTQGPKDPLCCPTLEVTNTYRFQTGLLSAMATPTAVVAVKPPALTLEQLMNAVYLTEFTASQKAKLTNGRYEEAIAPGSVSKISVAFVPQQFALGDLNGDGADDAVVFLSANTGGSGSFVSINAVLNDKGSPRAVSYLAIGDRVQIKGVAIKGGEITVNVVRQGPNDPMCCPTQEATLKYRLQAEKLVVVN
jgi:hypothetical protein